MFVLLSAILLAACGEETSDVPVSEVGLAFRIYLDAEDSSDGAGRSNKFHIDGDLFTIKNGHERKLFLDNKERLTISDGEHEYDLYTNYHMFAEHFFFYFPTSEPFHADSPYYILRYYRRDGEVLESRIETPTLPNFISPETNSEWLSSEQVLQVEWEDSALPIQEVALDTMCGSPHDDWKMFMRFPISDRRKLDIDLTARPYMQNCSNNAYLQIQQMPASALSIDSRLLNESRFELQRRRLRIIRERT